MKVHNDIKRCRFEKGEISQEKLASAVGVSRQTIYAIEKGKFTPSVALAIKIALFFDKKVEDIFQIRENDS